MVILADQLADSAITHLAPTRIGTIQKHGRRTAMNTQFVLDGRAMHIVARPQFALVVHHPLGHDEQGDAFDSGRCIGRSGQHQMDDVLSHVVLAIRNEDLLPGDPIGAI